jgi:hypothetical protein
MLSLLPVLVAIISCAPAASETNPYDDLRTGWFDDMIALNPSWSVNPNWFTNTVLVDIWGDAHSRIKSFLPSNISDTNYATSVKPIYSEKAEGWISYNCTNGTYGRFPVKQHMDIGLANFATLDVVGTGIGTIQHADGSAVDLGSVLGGIDDPISSAHNGRWFAFTLRPHAGAKSGVLTGANYGYRDYLIGGHIPPTCSSEGVVAQFNIIARYNLYKV